MFWSPMFLNHCAHFYSAMLQVHAVKRYMGLTMGREPGVNSSGLLNEYHMIAVCKLKVKMANSKPAWRMRTCRLHGVC